MQWAESFGTWQEWSSGCSVCQGQRFLGSADPLQIGMPFREASSDACPCWFLYMAMQRLWSKEFPKAYLLWNWDSTFPLKTPLAADHAWYVKHPESFAWRFSEPDEEAIRFWVNTPEVVVNKGLSLVIHGDKGVGKSSLATVLSKELVKRRGVDASGYISDFTVRFLVGDELYQYLGMRSREGHAVLDEAFKSSLLVIDDLRLAYTGFVNTELVERVHSILQSRAGNNLPTIITMNKLSKSADFKPNSVTEFLGIDADHVPDKFGKYRFVQVINDPMRPAPDWTL
jgi:hypothetical protein